MKKIAYYITAHGYGHGTRSCDILNALHTAAPAVEIIVKTDLPLAFMQSRLTFPVKIIPSAFDVGLIQKDSIHVDLEASIEAVEALYAQESRLIEGELGHAQATVEGDVAPEAHAPPERSLGFFDALAGPELVVVPVPLHIEAGGRRLE